MKTKVKLNILKLEKLNWNENTNDSESLLHV